MSLSSKQIIGIFISKNTETLLENKSINNNLFQLFVNKLNSTFNDYSIFTNSSLLEMGTLIKSSSEVDFLKKASAHLPAILEDTEIDEEYIIYFEGIFPIYDLSLCHELQERHCKYISQYSYSENLPPGIVPKFISREFIISLSDKLETTVHEYLLKNINNYDTEIFYKEPDLRYMRLDFSLTNERSINLCNEIISHNNNFSYNQIQDIIKNKPSVFRTTPSYIEIEIHRGCEYECSFCLRKIMDMSSDNISISLETIEKIKLSIENDFKTPLTICLGGGLGEPLLHPDFNAILIKLLSISNLKEIIIETALYKNVDVLFDTIEKIPENLRNKIVLIINLITINKNNYKEIYKSNSNPEEIIIKAEKLSTVIPKKNIYFQAIKIKEIENEIESYFTELEKLKFPIILQKYNTFANRLPQKRVSDLTPIQREFCWHLARELYINADGTVAVCRASENTIIGNLKTDSLNVIWQKGLSSFAESLVGNHNMTKAPCINCDEWYTFNA
jgi:spiro-SPASM protein